MKHLQPTRDTKILHIAYVPPGAGFVLPIITRIQHSSLPDVAARMADWTNGPLRELGLSLSTRISVLAVVSTKLMTTRNAFLQAVPAEKEVSEYLAKGAGWWPTNRTLPYELLLSIEAFYFEFRSAYEILAKFLVAFFKDIVGRSIGKDEIFEKLAKEGVATEWVEDLRVNRNLFAHDSPPWIAVSIDVPNNGDRDVLILATPDADLTNPAQCIPFSRLLAIYGGLDAALRSIHDWALKEVTALEERVARKK